MEEEFVQEFIKKKMVKYVELMGASEKRNDPQCEIMLFRVCMGLSKLCYTLCTCTPKYFGETSAQFDTVLKKKLDYIVMSDGPDFGDFPWRLATLPIRSDGLGVHDAGNAR
ncbi:hypothetical protein AgCh_040235 [Apium graveolens]